jgi:hypothetical protein
MAKTVVSGESGSKIELKKAAPLRRCLIVFVQTRWALNLFEKRSIQVQSILVWDCTFSAVAPNFIFALFSFSSFL